MPNAPKKDNSQEKAEDLGKQAQDTVKKVVDYASGLNNETIAYIVLAVGVFLFFISPVFGGAIVGVVVGLTFADQITTAIKAAKSYFQKEQLGRTIVFLSLLVVLVYALPTLFLGAIAAVGVVTLVTSESKEKKAK